jgi:hypothetical protein
MTIHEQTLTSSTMPVTTGAEWTARALRPVARWALVPGERGTARLEMVWSVPDPQPGDALAR